MNHINDVQVKLPIEGMTCSGCEFHVTKVLEKIGAQNVKTSYRQGDTRFRIAETDIEKAKNIIAEEIGYKVGKEELTALTKELDNDKEENQEGFFAKIKGILKI